MAVSPDSELTFIEWAIAGVMAIIAFAFQRLWRVASNVGSVMTTIETIESRQTAAEADIKALNQGQHSIETTLASLPDIISRRFDSRFDDLTTRIDRMLDSRIDTLFGRHAADR